MRSAGGGNLGDEGEGDLVQLGYNHQKVLKSEAKVGACKWGPFWDIAIINHLSGRNSHTMSYPSYIHKIYQHMFFRNQPKTQQTIRPTNTFCQRLTPFLSRGSM